MSRTIPIGIILGLIAVFGPLSLVASTDNYTAVTQNRTAIFQYIQTISPKISSENSWLIADQLASAGSDVQVDPKFVAAVMAVESKFNARAYNHGAAGLGQLMPSTARNVGIKDPYSITENVLGTTKYIREQIDYFGPNPSNEIVLASYLQGPMRIGRQQSRFSNRASRYIAAVMSHYEKLKGLFQTVPITEPIVAVTNSKPADSNPPQASQTVAVASQSPSTNFITSPQ